MKKILTALVLSFFILSTCLPAAAQRFGGRILKKQQIILVKYNKIKAFSDGQGVWLEWETNSESDNLGFYVHKVGDETKTAADGRFIPGAYFETGDTVSSGGKYSFFDAAGDLNSEYYIESVNTSGKTNNSNAVSPEYVENLESITGVASASLKSSAKTATPTRIKDENILPSDLRAEVRSTSAQPDRAKQFFVATQLGVKIGVKREGIFRVTRAQLQANGFDVSVAPELWQLYANGNEQPMSVGGGDFIEFYGRGIETLESDTQTYFLIAGAAKGRRIGTTVRRAVGGRITDSNYSQSVTKKDRLIYINRQLS